MFMGWPLPSFCLNVLLTEFGVSRVQIRIKERRDCGVAPDARYRSSTPILSSHACLKHFSFHPFSYFPADRTCVCTGAAAKRQGSSDP